MAELGEALLGGFAGGVEGDDAAATSSSDGGASSTASLAVPAACVGAPNDLVSLVLHRASGTSTCRCGVNCGLDPNHWVKTMAPPRSGPRTPSRRATCRCHRHTAFTSRRSSLLDSTGRLLGGFVVGLAPQVVRWRRAG